MAKLTIEIEQVEDGDSIVSSPIITKVLVNDKPVSCLRSLYLLVTGDVVQVSAEFNDDVMSLQNAHILAVLPFVEAKVLLSVTEALDAEKNDPSVGHGG